MPKQFPGIAGPARWAACRTCFGVFGGYLAAPPTHGDQPVRVHLTYSSKPQPCPFRGARSSGTRRADELASSESSRQCPDPVTGPGRPPALQSRGLGSNPDRSRACPAGAGHRRPGCRVMPDYPIRTSPTAGRQLQPGCKQIASRGDAQRLWSELTPPSRVLPRRIRFEGCSDHGFPVDTLPRKGCKVDYKASWLQRRHRWRWAGRQAGTLRSGTVLLTCPCRYIALRAV